MHGAAYHSQPLLDARGTGFHPAGRDKAIGSPGRMRTLGPSQQQMAKVEEELKATTVDASASGGMVKVAVKGVIPPIEV